MTKRRPSDVTLDKCDIHKSVLDLCIDDLVAQQVFSKSSVLHRLNLLGVSAAIYWDYIRRKIETGYDDAVGQSVALLPVSGAFFKRARKQNMSLNSLLAGPGGKAAGFALATIDGGQIALASITLRINQVEGADKATKVRAAALAKSIGEGTVSKQIKGKAGIKLVGAAG